MGVLLRTLATGVVVVVVLGALPALGQPVGEGATPSADGNDGGVAEEAAEPKAPEETEEAEGLDEPATEPPELVASKEAFQKAQAVRKESGCERAVPLYLRSRALNPALSNTLNAALCLEKLSRGDEALVLYEALLSEQAGQLPPKLETAAKASLERLRGKVGTLAVTSGAEGAVVVVDGRRRGTLPLAQPLPVLAGTRTVQVVKEGHEPFVTAVDVVVSETVSVKAETPLLTQSGGLEVALAELEGAEIWLDGAPVGHVPWSGKLAPGRYLLQVMQWDRGTAPREVVIVAGQTARLDLEAATLGPEVTVVTDPPGATVTLGHEETALGEAPWRGRLPLGSWTFRARQEGYADGLTRFDSRADGRAERIVLSLEVDEDHPRWAMDKAPSFRFVLAALGGPVIAPSVGGASSSCEQDSCTRNSAGVGGLVGLRGGFELPFGLSIELLGGYLGLGQAVDRNTSQPFDSGEQMVMTAYTVFNRLSLQGGFAAAGLGYQLALFDPIELRVGAAFGAAFLRVGDPVEGTVSAGGIVAPVDVAGAGESTTAVDLIVLPEITVGGRLGALWLGVGVSAPVLLLGGPSDRLGDAFVRGSCDPATDATAVACAPGQALFEGEALYDPMVMVMPMAQAGYRFE